MTTFVVAVVAIAAVSCVAIASLTYMFVQADREAGRRILRERTLGQLRRTRDAAARGTAAQAVVEKRRDPTLPVWREPGRDA